MKLLKCHVVSFGALSDFEIDFNDGVTVIKQDNGSGKSTLAAFVKAMFYGLSGSSKTKIEENERLRYDPWQGGEYGGTLDFEIQKGSYRIERYFGAKASADRFKLYDLSTGTLITDFSQNLGEELFGIDAAGFERSTYLPQSATAQGFSGSISAKLNNLVEAGDDISNYESAVEALKKRRVYYRKFKGIAGAVLDTETEISALESEIADARISVENLGRYKETEKSNKAETEDLKQKLALIRKRITEASAAEKIAADNKRRNELVSDLGRTQAEIEKLKVKYKGVFPSGDELNNAGLIAQTIADSRREAELLSADSTDKKELECTKSFFAAGVPSDDEIKNCRDSMRKAEASSIRAEAAKASAESETVTAGKSRVPLVLIIAAVLVAAAGAVLFVSGTVAAGAVCVAAAALIAGIAGFLYLKELIAASGAKSASREQSAKSEQQLAVESESYMAEASAFIGKYTDTSDPDNGINLISENKNTLLRLLDAQKKRDERIAICRLAADKAENELREFLLRFAVSATDDFDEELHSLRTAGESYTRLEKTVAELTARLEALGEPVAFQSKTAERATVADLTAEEKLLLQKIDELSRESAVNIRRTEQLSIAADALPELCDRLEAKKAELLTYNNNLLILDTTLDLLEKAKEGLSKRYMSTMRNGFRKYMDEISGSDTGEFLLTPDFEVSLERNGSARSKAFFSSGVKDMMDIAMRFALTDALFTGEKPPMILDDPFVNLDDANTLSALEIIKKLSANRQIIYFTCNSSRCYNTDNTI